MGGFGRWCPWGQHKIGKEVEMWRFASWCYRYEVGRGAGYGGLGRGRAGHDALSQADTSSPVECSGLSCITRTAQWLLKQWSGDLTPFSFPWTSFTCKNTAFSHHAHRSIPHPLQTAKTPRSIQEEGDPQTIHDEAPFDCFWIFYHTFISKELRHIKKIERLFHEEITSPFLHCTKLCQGMSSSEDSPTPACKLKCLSFLHFGHFLFTSFTLVTRPQVRARRATNKGKYSTGGCMNALDENEGEFWAMPTLYFPLPHLLPSLFLSPSCIFKELRGHAESEWTMTTGRCSPHLLLFPLNTLHFPQLTTPLLREGTWYIYVICVILAYYILNWTQES